MFDDTELTVTNEFSHHLPAVQDDRLKTVSSSHFCKMPVIMNKVMLNLPRILRIFFSCKNNLHEGFPLVSLYKKLVFLLLLAGHFGNKFHVNLSVKISGTFLLIIFRIKFFENNLLNMYVIS